MLGFTPAVVVELSLSAEDDAAAPAEVSVPLERFNIKMTDNQMKQKTYILVNLKSPSNSIR